MKNTPTNPVPKWNQKLTSSWLAFAAADDQKNLNYLGEALDSALRDCRPNESFGSLSPHANEIRQDAHLVLLYGDGLFSTRERIKQRRGYLAGNQELLEATASGDELEIERQILRSAQAALNHCYLRLRRSLARDHALLLGMEEVAEEKLGVHWHPSDLTQYSDARRRLISDLLREAAEGSLFPKETIALAGVVFSGTARSSDLAREHGVSRQALHQRIQPFRKWLMRRARSLEGPLL